MQAASEALEFEKAMEFRDLLIQCASGGAEAENYKF